MHGKPLGLAALLLAAAGPAAAEPLAARASWAGTIGTFTTGAALAVDGPDVDGTQVDTLRQPAAVVVGAADVPATARVTAAYLYWAGTIDDQMDCALAPAAIDATVLLATPGSAAFAPVAADVCTCAAGAAAYDLQACRADITARVAASGMIGTFQVDGFAARITNGLTDNASFALVLVYDEPTLKPRRAALFDGVEELVMGTRRVALSGLDIDNPAVGALSWYVLDGDYGGAGPESVAVTGVPSGRTATLSDGVNPAGNPMNGTINTTSPPQIGTNGVDLDRLDLSAALDPADTAVDITYTAGEDKYWVVFNLVEVGVFTPVIGSDSAKTWSLERDADGSGGPSAGDTIRYTITLHNAGTAPAVVDLTDPIPAAAASWTLVATGGGVDASTATSLVVNDVAIAPGASAAVILDLVLAAASAGTTVHNVAAFDARPDGNAGTLEAPPLAVLLPGAPDAAPAPDAAAPDAAARPDAAAAPDAFAPGDSDGGCDCRLARGGPARSRAGAALLLVAAALAATRRRLAGRRCRGRPGADAVSHGSGAHDPMGGVRGEPAPPVQRTAAAKRKRSGTTERGRLASEPSDRV